MITNGDDAHAVAELAARILAPARTMPVVVVTTRFGSSTPLIDLDRFAAELDGTAELWFVSDPLLTRELGEALPPDCAVYNGAIRTYPPGIEWRTRPRLARRRFSYDDAEAEALASLALGDALDAAHQGAYVGGTVGGASPTRRASGTVASILAGGERAFVALDDGTMAFVAQQAGIAPAPLDWVLEVGARVSGALDESSKRLHPDLAIGGADDLWQSYPVGSVIVALVARVERQRATLLAHPGVAVTVTRSDLSSNPRDRVDLLLTEGDVVEVRVVRDEQGRVALRTIDLDDDEPVTDALPVIAGGPPWLLPGRPLRPEGNDDDDVDALLDAGNGVDALLTTIEDAVSVDTPSPAPAPYSDPGPETGPKPLPGPGRRPAATPTAPIPVVTSAAEGTDTAPGASARGALKSALETVARQKAELEALRAELKRAHGSSEAARIAQLQAAVRELSDRRSAADARAEQAAQKIRDLQASLRQARRIAAADPAQRETPASPAERRARFASADEWVRHEMYVLWVDRLDAATRAEHPWPAPIALGDRFAASVEALPAAKVEKALRCAMEAVCGVIDTKPAREVHALRSGDGASAAPVVRGDGARCKRAYVEQKTPQALRLHYWVLPGGGVELSRVVAHDDVEP